MPEVPLPQPSGFGCEAEHPLESGTLENGRRLPLRAGQEIERGPHADLHERQPVAMLVHPAFLLRAPETHEEHLDPAVHDRPGDLVVLAVYYPDARDAVEQYADQLAGKPVVDITNPVNETFDGLVVPPDGSATQELAALAPEARFVKAFNTTFARTLEPGEVSGHAIDVLIAGDDEPAKDAVATFARDGGLNPIDTGPLRRARELEAAGLLHMTLQDKLGTGFGSALKFIA